MRQAPRSMRATIGPADERAMIAACCLSANKQSPARRMTGAGGSGRRGVPALSRPDSGGTVRPVASPQARYRNAARSSSAISVTAA
jgi:hypothetical protein